MAANTRGACATGASPLPPSRHAADSEVLAPLTPRVRAQYSYSCQSRNQNDHYSSTPSAHEPIATSRYQYSTPASRCHSSNIACSIITHSSRTTKIFIVRKPASTRTSSIYPTNGQARNSEKSSKSILTTITTTKTSRNPISSIPSQHRPR